MKTCTDLEQSNKLAEILPIESADQTWVRIVIAGDALDVPKELQYRHNSTAFNSFRGMGIPCWSLAALLEQLSKITSYTIDVSNGSILLIVSPKTTFGTLKSQGVELLDICYAMIIKLKELNIL